MAVRASLVGTQLSALARLHFGLGSRNPSNVSSVSRVILDQTHGVVVGDIYMASEQGHDYGLFSAYYLVASQGPRLLSNEGIRCPLPSTDQRTLLVSRRKRLLWQRLLLGGLYRLTMPVVVVRMCEHAHEASLQTVYRNACMRG